MSAETPSLAVRCVRELLKAMGEDPEREGLLETPARYVRALRELTGGLAIDPAEALGKTFAADGYDEIIAVEHQFISLCEHHLLPFTGTVHFAYLPKDRIVGLSKIPRMVEALERRPQVQERLTAQIADVFMRAVQPRGVAVVLKGTHTCMSIRGVKRPGVMTTSARAGVFAQDKDAHREALLLMGLGR